MANKCSAAWTSQFDDIIQQLHDLQQSEYTVFQNLRSLANAAPETKESTEEIKRAQNSLKEVIKQLTEKRQALFEQLKTRYTSAECGLSSDRKSLSDQITMVQVVEDRLAQIKKEVIFIESTHDNKRRMVEIGDYEYNRYSAHKNIFRNISFCCLGILVGVVLKKKEWQTMGSIVIITSILLCIAFTLGGLLDNASRSARWWNRYAWSADESIDKNGVPGGETKWEHNKKAFGKLFNANLLSSCKGDSKSSIASLFDSYVKKNNVGDDGDDMCVGKKDANTPYYHTDLKNPGCCVGTPWDSGGVKYCSKK